MLFCSYCQKNYFTKLREPISNDNKKLEKLFILKYKTYHCPTEKEEKIKCLKCFNNLYFKLSQNNQKNEENINIVYCIKCKLKYNLKEVFFKCKICLKNFKCQAKIYRDFPNKKKKLLFLIHTLLRNKNALPNINFCIKKCNCDLNNISQYTHDDEGKLLEGIKNNKKTVICNKCFKIFNYNELIWTCPLCKNIFKYKNFHVSKIKSKSINNNRKLNTKNIFKQEFKKIPIFKINLNKINSSEESNLNEKLLKTDENHIKLKKNKTIEKHNSSIHSQSIIDEKIKRIFINRKEINKKNNKEKIIVIKSKSRNVSKYKDDNNNNNINIINNKNNRDKTANNSKSKRNNYKTISIGNENNKKELEKNKLNQKEKKNKKTVDKKKIFNDIKKSLLNINEYSDEEYSQNAYKNRIRVSGRILNSNKGKKIYEENKPIKPKEKNSYSIKTNDLYKFDISGENFLEEKDEIYNNDGNMNIYSNKERFSIENYENLPEENKKNKNINYAKKIFFFNGKKEKDSNSFDENINFNKCEVKSLFKRFVKNNHNNIKNDDNLNNINQYFNQNNIYNINNYENYYLNFQNYVETPQFNLYNFNSENYTIINLLGKGSTGKIYLVEEFQTHQRFALKTMLIDNELDLKEKEDKYNLIYKLTYENPELKIINIYGLEIRKIDNYNMFLNVLMEKGEYDWDTEISNRNKTKNFYTEQELLYILTNLVATFAYMQQKGISHRDVKPQNILCFGRNEYKICDFGEAKYHYDKKQMDYENNLDASNQTIRGTEMYMSPILFRAVKYRPDSLTKYNSFKSDVFSLGLCFLYASSLDLNILFKVRDIIDMEKIAIIVNNYLSNRYSQEFIELLLYMLQVDENYRPDFIELNSWILFGNY